MSIQELIDQVLSLSKRYPKIITAHELVGQTYFLLQGSHTLDALPTLLARLSQSEVEKYRTAVDELVEAYDDFKEVEGFWLSAVIANSASGPATMAVDDRMVPSEFVTRLKRSLGERREKLSV